MANCLCFCPFPPLIDGDDLKEFLLLDKAKEELENARAHSKEWKNLADSKLAIREASIAFHENKNEANKAICMIAHNRFLKAEKEVKNDPLLKASKQRFEQARRYYENVVKVGTLEFI
jgi:hypothetical protein